jgi:hypothetical protein
VIDSLAHETKALERKTLRPEPKATPLPPNASATAVAVAAATTNLGISAVSLPDYAATDMGTFPLKGISAPVKIYQLTHRDLATRKFPPLRVDVPDEEPDHHEPDEAPAVDAGAVVVAAAAAAGGGSAPATPATPATSAAPASSPSTPSSAATRQVV